MIHGLDETQYRPKYPDSPFINIAGLVNQETGKTYREENAEQKHNIPVGALVEIKSGVRLFVVAHNRDCDQTPLYCLAADKDDIIVEHQGFANRKWHCGYLESSLVKVR